jgi:F0F1-type ATP synthase membrane subunit b/b'
MYDDLSDICLVDDLQETTKAADDNLLLSKIVMAYEQILSDKELQSQQVLKNELTEAKKEHDSKKSQEKKRMEQDKQKIRQKLGEELFDDVYLYLWTQRQQESTDEG